MCTLATLFLLLAACTPGLLGLHRSCQLRRHCYDRGGLPNFDKDRLPSSSSRRLFSSVLQREVEAAMALSPYIDPSILTIDNDLNYSSDLLKFRGYVEYAAQQRDFGRFVLPQLRNARYSLERVAALSNGRFTAQWNVTYAPDGIAGFLLVATLLPMLIKVEPFDILDREGFKASFSWEQLRAFAARTLSTGRMRLPHAVIKGQTELVFVQQPIQQTDTAAAAAATGVSGKPSLVLVRHKESLSLVRSIAVGRLKNRLLVGHLLEYLSACRPQSIDFETWENLIASSVKYLSVPGMRQFDVDGLEGEDQQRLLEAGGGLLGLFTFMVLLFGLAFATAVINKLH